MSFLSLLLVHGFQPSRIGRLSNVYRSFDCTRSFIYT